MFHVRRFRDSSGMLGIVVHSVLFLYLLPFTDVIVFMQSTCLFLVLSFILLRLPIEVIVDAVIINVVFFPIFVILHVFNSGYYSFDVYALLR